MTLGTGRASSQRALSQRKKLGLLGNLLQLGHAELGSPGSVERYHGDPDSFFAGACGTHSTPPCRSKGGGGVGEKKKKKPGGINMGRSQEFASDERVSMRFGSNRSCATRALSYRHSPLMPPIDSGNENSSGWDVEMARARVSRFLRSSILASIAG